MESYPLTRFGNKDKAGLHSFLCFCRDKAKADAHPVLASISLASEYIDPLAVLQTVNESGTEHCYLEHPSRREGVSCAEPVLKFQSSGANRFSELRDFAEYWFAHSVSTGDEGLPWAGPRFFCEASFEDTLESENFLAPVFAFVPRWQVGWKGNRFSAMANLIVNESIDLDRLIEPVWRAHQRFASFEFGPENQENRLNVLASQTEILEQRLSERNYLEAVDSALGEIHSGSLEKVVISRDLRLKSDQVFEPLEILNILRTRYPDCHTFSFQNDLGASIIGATPERLIKVENGRFETEALAGSIERGQNARQDAHYTRQLLNSEKERSEHGLVLRYICEELRELGIAVNFAEVPEILQLSNIQHLRVPVSGEIPKSAHLLDLVSKLHPTPAMGGYPADKAKALIRKLEKRERGPYAGLTGWFDAAGAGEMVVNIRCAKIESSSATLYAGAGIVKDSVAEKELKETELKFIGMLPTFVNLDEAL